MSEKLNITKEQLINAFHAWNVDVSENPNDFKDADPTKIEDAEQQVDKLLSYIFE